MTGPGRHQRPDSVDWTAVRRRMDAAAAALDGSAHPDPERVRAVLEERARALARVPPTPPGAMLQLVTFALAREVYAAESRYVTAVFRLTELSPLPGAALPVFGVTGWRGELLTILDLRRLLGLSATVLNDQMQVVVLGALRPVFGVLVDDVRGLISIPESDVRPPPDAVGSPREHIRGVTSDALLLLDAEKLLRDHI